MAFNRVAVSRTSQGGTSEYDQADSGDSMSDGSVFFVGHTEGNWNGTSYGGFDFAGAMISADGDELWRWQVRSHGLRDS